MVETAEADVVCGTVAGDNPLRAGGDEALELDDGLADIAAAGFAEGHELVGNLTGNACAVGSVEPLLSQSLHLVGALATFEHLLEEVGEAVAKLFGTELHAEAKFSEVLEE